jgi:hypothetical protein
MAQPAARQSQSLVTALTLCRPSNRTFRTVLNGAYFPELLIFNVTVAL